MYTLAHLVTYPLKTLLMVYVLTQLTILSNRLAESTQQLAILEARRGEAAGRRAPSARPHVDG
jgi:hypothetical protein